MAISLGTHLSKVLPEHISRGCVAMTKVADPAFQHVQDTVDNVSANDDMAEISRDWKWRHPVDVGVAGAGRFATVDLANQFHDNSSGPGFGPGSPGFLANMQTFPTHRESAFIGWDQFVVQLVQYMGNIFFPKNLLRANMLKAMRTDIVAKNIKGWVMKSVHAQITMFYTKNNQNGQREMSTIGSVTAGGTTGDNYVKFTPTGGRIFMYVPGQMLSQFNAAHAEQNAAHYIAVTKVDKRNGIVTAATVDGTNFTDAVQATNYFTLRGSAGLGYQGLRDWLKEGDGDVIQGITLGNIPDLKSFICTENSPLSETLWNKWSMSYGQAYGYELDTGIADPMVLAKYVENIQSGYGLASATAVPYVHMRDNGPLDLTQGFEGLKLQHGPRKIEVFAGGYQLEGYADFFRSKGGVMKRLRVPKLENVGKRNDFGPDVEFEYGENGGSVFGHYFTNPSGTDVALTNVRHAPYTQIFNYAHTMPRGLSFTNLQRATLA